MHDSLQLGTLILVLSGIMLNRYDYSALRKEIRGEMGELRKEIASLRTEVHSEMTALRAEVHKDIADLRTEFQRKTDTFVAMLFDHAERFTKLEAKMEGKQ